MLLRAFFCSLILVASQAATASLPDFTEIVEDSSPAVVKVMAEVRTPPPDASNRMEQLEELDQLPDALKRFFSTETHLHREGVRAQDLSSLKTVTS